MNQLLESLDGFTRYGFLLRALVAGLLLALVCGQLSPIVVMRRLSFSADGLAHASLGGLATGLFLLDDGSTPGLGSYVVALLFTCGIGALMAWLHRGGRLGSDTAIGACYVAAFALGAILLSWRRHYTGHLEALFFGTLLAIQWLDCLLLALLATVIATCLLLFGASLQRWCFDEDLARASGVRVHLLRGALLVLLAASIVLSVKLVGLLLVTSLLILPGAIGTLCARRFTTILAWSIGTATLAVVGGLVLSNAIDTPPGPSTVLLAFAAFMAAFLRQGRNHRHPDPATPRDPLPSTIATQPQA